MENLEQRFEDNKNVSLGEWMITYLVMIIPLVNIIMLFVWGFSSDTKPSKATWAKASLIWMAIGTVLSIIFFGTFMGIMMAAMQSY